MSVTQNSLVSRSLEELSIREDEESQHEVIKDVAGMVFIGTQKSSFAFNCDLSISFFFQLIRRIKRNKCHTSNICSRHVVFPRCKNQSTGRA